MKYFLWKHSLFTICLIIFFPFLILIYFSILRSFLRNNVLFNVNQMIQLQIKSVCITFDNHLSFKIILLWVNIFTHIQLKYIIKVNFEYAIILLQFITQSAWLHSISEWDKVLCLENRYSFQFLNLFSGQRALSHSKIEYSLVGWMPNGKCIISYYEKFLVQ